MKGPLVLSVASEVFPLAKTGGLADVAGALPLALAAEGVAVRTLLPGYPAVLKAIGRAQPVHTYHALLEGALKKVLAYSSFHGRVIALDLAKEALKDLIRSVRNVGIDNIQKTVADYYKMKVADLFSKKRTRAIARPRQLAMWLWREVTSHSFPEIGDAFGGRDHTTVIHAVKTIDSLRLKESELNHDLHVLLQVLKG